MLVLSEVHSHYGNIEALRGVSVRVDQGEIVTIIGANGAGKSTLLMTICGRPRASGGDIVFDGQRLNGLEPYDIVGYGIAQAPEGRRIFPSMSVLENLQMGAVPTNGEFFEEDVQKVFALFPRLEERLSGTGVYGVPGPAPWRRSTCSGERCSDNRYHDLLCTAGAWSLVFLAKSYSGDCAEERRG